MIKFLAVAAAIAVATPVCAVEFIANGNFETGNIAGWTATGNLGVAPTPFFGISDPAYGSYALDFNGGNTTPNGVLSQTITTSAGQAYNFSFNYGVTSGGNQSLLAEIVDSTSFAVISSTTVFTTSSSPTLYSATFNALSSGTIVRFSDVATNPTNGQDVVIDNVSVTGPAIAAVPEPASWALMIVGFGLVGVNARRRLRITAAA